MQISTRRFLLRDLDAADRAAFLSYQTDPRYRRLYDLDETYRERASELFRLFLSWQQEQPRRNYQLGIFERGTGRLRRLATAGGGRGPGFPWNRARP